MSTVSVGGRDLLEHAEDLAHVHGLTDDLTEALRLRRGDLLGAAFVGHETDARVADDERSAGVQQALLELDAAHARAVGRAEIAEHVALVGVADLAVEARGVRVVEHDIVRRRSADAHLTLREHHAALTRALRDHQSREANGRGLFAPERDRRLRFAIRITSHGRIFSRVARRVNRCTAIRRTPRRGNFGQRVRIPEAGRDRLSAPRRDFSSSGDFLGRHQAC